MIIKKKDGLYQYHSPGKKDNNPVRDFCKPLPNNIGGCFPDNSNYGGIKSVHVMSIEEATRLGILNEPTVNEDEQDRVQSINMVDNPLPGFEFAVVNDSKELKLQEYEHTISFEQKPLTKSEIAKLKDAFEEVGKAMSRTFVIESDISSVQRRNNNERKY